MRKNNLTTALIKRPLIVAVFFWLNLSLLCFLFWAFCFRFLAAFKTNAQLNILEKLINQPSVCRTVFTPVIKSPLL